MQTKSSLSNHDVSQDKALGEPTTCSPSGRSSRSLSDIIRIQLASILRSIAITVLGVSSVGAWTQTSAPKWKPERTVTLVVPYPAGGGTDAIARATARRLSELWGHPVVVDNVSGANGLIGSQRVAQAKPDGHTFLVQLPSIVLIKYLPGQREADPLPRLRPVSVITEYPNVIVASGRVPASQWTGFLEHCKAKSSCAFASVDHVTRLLGLQIKEDLAIPHLAVAPYRGTAPMVIDLISNTVDFSIAGVTTALPHVKTGAVTVLATLGRNRAPSLPNVPTVAEVGMPQLTSTSWVALLAPKDTPSNIVDALSEAMREAIKDSGVMRTIEASGGYPVAGSPKELGDLLAAEDRRLSTLIDRFKIE